MKSRMRRSKRRFWSVRSVLLFFLAAGVIGLAELAGCGASYAAPEGPRLVAGPMVQAVGVDSFAVVWRIKGDVPGDARLLDAAGNPFATGQIFENAGGRVAARFDGLQPSTEYRYRITAGAETLAEGTARTAPAAGEAFRIVAFGDSGNGSQEQARIAALVQKFDPRVVIHTGDLIYLTGSRGDYREKFYEPNAVLIARAPFYPCIGNHDYFTERGMPLLDEFVLPRNGPTSETPERHYWFDFGDVRFVGIDSNRSEEELRDRVAPWLRDALDAAAGRWKIVFFHHPPYTSGRYDPTERVLDALVPVMEDSGVQLVLCGHDHMYQRTHPVRAGFVVEPGKGTVYVVTGAGGADLYAKSSTVAPQIAVRYDEKHSFTVIDVAGQNLTLRQIDITERVIDEYTVPRDPPG